MFKRIKEDENLRQWWWAHLLHWGQGWLVASLIAGGWPVAGVTFAAFLLLYQVIEFWVLRLRTGKGDRLIRDWKIISFGYMAGLLYYFLTGWTLIEGVRQLWQTIT